MLSKFLLTLCLLGAGQVYAFEASKGCPDFYGVFSVKSKMTLNDVSKLIPKLNSSPLFRKISKVNVHDFDIKDFNCLGEKFDIKFSFEDERIAYIFMRLSHASDTFENLDTQRAQNTYDKGFQWLTKAYGKPVSDKKMNHSTDSVARNATWSKSDGSVAKILHVGKGVSMYFEYK